MRFNAVKHGLTASLPLIPEEDESRFAALREAILSDLRPVSPLESLLAERAACLAWRLGRAARIEAGVLTWQFYSALADRAEADARSYERTGSDELGDILGSVMRVTDEGKHGRAVVRADEARAKRDTPVADIGAAFVRDAEQANAMAKLSRYEVSLERSLYRTLRAFDGLRAARAPTQHDGS